MHSTAKRMSITETFAAKIVALIPAWKARRTAKLMDAVVESSGKTSTKPFEGLL